MSTEKIIADWKKKQFKPIYWLEGEEFFYIDELTTYAEHSILNETEAAFNLLIFYGRETDWAAIVNACTRYPMFAQKQVVLIKEAQHMKDIEKLESYIENPLVSTILIIGYKEKSLDKRTKFYKVLKAKAEIFHAEKIRDYKLPDWILDYAKHKGYQMSDKSAILLANYLGNELSTIANEIGKLILNLKGKTEITERDIEQYVGISKDYNAFELQAAIARKDMAKAIKIIQYFSSNPKAAPIQMVLPALYSSFSKIWSACELPDKSESALRPHFYNNPEAVKNAIATMKLYGKTGLEKILLLLHHYNLKSIGINTGGNISSDALLKEMVLKIML